ncbi:MAG TPA: ABC transporter substrate-binding protein [Dehalococcoidia bacterium]|nr:ABC transporter substrate-binding protein [Dehalococcoidia bacterium]
MGSYWTTILGRRLSRRRALGAMGLTAGAAAFLAACGGGSDKGADSPSGSTSGNASGITQGYLAKAADGKRGGTMGFIYTDSPNLNILTNALEYAGYGGQYVYDHLISSRSNENAPFVLEAAEALEQPDEITIRFKLRPGMTYHNIPPVNGRAVKASDIVAVQNHVKTLTGAENAFQNDILDRVEAPDDNNVIFKLKAPTAYLFTSRMLGHPGPQAIIPPETFDNLATGRQVGSGPFQLDQWVISSRYHYTRFDKYHGRGKPGTLPYRDATDVFNLTDDAPRQAAFRSEQVHYYTPAAGAFKETASSMGSMATPVEWIGLAPYTWNFGMQRGRGAWANPSDTRMRQAAYRLTDRKQMIDLRYSGSAVLTTGILAAGQSKEFQLEAKDTDQYFKYDVAEGKKLLEAAGWDFNKELVCEIIGTQNQSGAEILKQQWAKAGLKMRIEVVNAGEFLPRSNRGEYDLFHGSHPQYDSPQAPLRQNHSISKLAFGGSGLGLPEIDAMIEKAERTTNFEANAKLVREVQLELLKRYTPYYNILTPYNQVLVNRKVKNLEIESSNATLHRADAWLG